MSLCIKRYRKYIEPKSVFNLLTFTKVYHGTSNIHGGNRANSWILLKISLQKSSNPVSIHSKMLVFQVPYYSLKPGEAFMAYSLRSDIKKYRKHQVKDRELDTSTNDLINGLRKSSLQILKGYL